MCDTFEAVCAPGCTLGGSSNHSSSSSTSLALPCSDSVTRWRGTCAAEEGPSWERWKDDAENFRCKVSCLVEQIRFVSKHSTPQQRVAIVINHDLLLSSFPLSITLVLLNQGIDTCNVGTFKFSSTQVQPMRYGPTFPFPGLF